MIRIAKTKKNTRRTEFFLGTSFNDAKRRIESKFKKGMTWDNHGKVWEIDHIIPLSAFDFNREENLKIANHISNLQPLFVFENRSTNTEIKFVKLNATDISAYKDRFNEFSIVVNTYFNTALNGQYTYTIYEQTSTTNTDPTGLNLLESGIMELEGTTISFTEYETTSTFTIRQ